MLFKETGVKAQFGSVMCWRNSTNHHAICRTFDLLTPQRGILACVSCADVAHTTRRTPEMQTETDGRQRARDEREGNRERRGTKKMKLCATNWKTQAQKRRFFFLRKSVKRCSENT